MRHTCHAISCKTEVPPTMFMCRRHWFMVPKPLRALVWKHYRPGQCDDKQPSKEWFDAANRAVKAVLAKEREAVAKRDAEWDKGAK